jgi:hypothetical protein
MSLSTAIGMVSESLRNLLVGEMTLKPVVPVTVLAPDESGGNRRINLFLYKVQENSTLKNMDWQVKNGDPGRIVPPPLSLNLFYLMTAYAANDPQKGNSAAHEILGEAMRVFYENAIVSQNYLVPGLKDAREQIKIVLNGMNLEELSMVWSTFTHPFRLSVLYEISVVQLEMLSKNEQDMARRVDKIGVPQVSAPFKPPVVESIDPMKGPVSSIITFHGNNLSGWKAYVVLTGRRICDEMELNMGDSFQVTLPSNLLKGFHEIQIDISHLFRRTFFFEVI